MGRLEAFAMSHSPLPSFIDGLANGLGYAYILVIVGGVREILGSGCLLGFRFIPQAVYNVGYRQQHDDYAGNGSDNSRLRYMD
mgnify:CR=1 FL=1